jgi:predicted alpha/beta superfamily hydrolase
MRGAAAGDESALCPALPGQVPGVAATGRSSDARDRPSKIRVKLDTKLRNSGYNRDMTRLLPPLLVTLALATYSTAAEPIVVGHTRAISSKILGEERLLQIGLPRNYERSEKRYPVLFRLDGESVFLQTLAAVEQLVYLEEAKGVPEMIVVGIPNTNRGRDMLPAQSKYAPKGADPARFLRFLRTEAIPFVASNYRTTDTRILAGQSTSGFFAWWAMLREPKLFEAVVVISPSFADCRDYMVREVRANAGDDALQGAYLHIARGGQGREQGVADSMSILLPLLRPSKGLRLQTQVYDELGHVPFPALYDALKTMGTGPFGANFGIQGKKP